MICKAELSRIAGASPCATLDKETERSNVPVVRRLNRRFSIEGILTKTEELIDDPHLARDVTLHLCHRYSGETLKNIGNHFGLGDSGVAKASFRLQKQLVVDAALHEKVKEIMKHLGYVNVQT
jgi:putative transposase